MTSAGSSLAARILRYWLPVFAMIGAMYFLSTDVFSNEHTRGFIETVVRWLHPAVSETRIAMLNHLSRKAGHFFEYAILAGLVYRAFKADRSTHWRLAWACYTLLIIITWALVDEFHQTRTHFRGGSIYDAALDTSGGVFAIVLIALYSIKQDISRRRVRT